MKRIPPLILVASLILSGNAFTAEKADVIYTNAKIHGYKDADTITVYDGNIQYVGNAEGAKQFGDKSTKVVDLAKAYVMPGFIDNHNHVFEAASEAGGSCELSMDASLEEQTPYLIACQRNSASQGWLMGYGFSLAAILNESNRQTPLELLDSIFPMRPVVLMEQTSHSMWVNSVALEIAGITKQTQDPQGGKILKDLDTGELNGLLFDNAGDIVMELAWNNLEGQFEQSYDGLMLGLRESASYGITTIGDGRLYWKRGWYDVWKRAEKDGNLTARVALRPWIYPADSMAPQLAFLKTIQSSNTSKLLISNQVKMYSDGITINGTAKMLAPYLDTYLTDEPYGINYIPPSQMKAWLDALDKVGYSAHIHAIGDGAVRESLNAIEHVRSKGATKPYTLTHVELVDANDVDRFKMLDVTADFQVGSDYVVEGDHSWSKLFLGAKRAHALMNLKAISDTGANLTLSSDWNVHDLNPLVGIANSIRMGNTGLPNVEAAIDAYTINAAHSLGLQDVTGSIEVGKSADFAILEQDITHLSPDDIAKTDILMTVLQGNIVYDAELHTETDVFN